MERNQYQNRNEYGQDLFQEYLDELPDPQIEISPMAERDVEKYQEQTEKKQKNQFRIKTLLMTCAAALIVNILGTPIWRRATYNPPAVKYNYPVEVIEYGPGDGVLDNDLKEQEVLIDGDYYHFPFKVSDLLDKGWEIDDDVDEVQYSEYVRLVRGDETLHVVSLISPDGTPCAPEDALVTGFIVYDSDTTDLVLPGGITCASTERDIIQAMRDSGLSWKYEESEYEGTVYSRHYTYYAPVEGDSFTYYIVEFTADQNGKIESIDIWLVDFTYPSGLDDAVNN